VSRFSFKLANPGGRSIAKLRNTQDFSRCVFDLPVGQITPKIFVQPFRKKYPAYPVGQIIAKTPANLSREEGRIAIVTDVGAGMRWTRKRRTRDAIAGRTPWVS
jgi:hypothetical protein